jgi:murein DD-endopeptidase MepM/ murein hydrolase activator NlpD
MIRQHAKGVIAPMLSLLLTAWVAGQGQALEMSFPAEPGLTGVTVLWSGHDVPFVHSGDRWLTLVGVDLDSRPGDHAVDVTFTYADGHKRVSREPVVVNAGQYPTTELQVEERYGNPNPDDEARAAREAAETNAIFATFTPERYWSEPFEVPVRGAKDGRNFGHRRVYNGQPRAPHSGTDLRANTGTPIFAANRGRVVLAKELFFSGNAVYIDHGYGLFTTYLHLSEIDVKVGDIVDRGQQLGLAGATGRVTGPHLHWGVRLVDARIDPFSLVRIGAL